MNLTNIRYYRWCMPVVVVAEWFAITSWALEVSPVAHAVRVVIALASY